MEQTRKSRWRASWWSCGDEEQTMKWSAHPHSLQRFCRSSPVPPASLCLLLCSNTDNKNSFYNTPSSLLCHAAFSALCKTDNHCNWETIKPLIATSRLWNVNKYENVLLKSGPPWGCFFKFRSRYAYNQPSDFRRLFSPWHTKAARLVSWHNKAEDCLRTSVLREDDAVIKLN